MSDAPRPASSLPPRIQLRAENGLPLIVHRGRGWRRGGELYAKLLSLTWPRIVLLFVVVYLLTTLAFAWLYLLAPAGSVAHLPEDSFMDAFAFSLQTISTIGYGAMSPSSAWAHMLVTLEALAGLLGVALTTGLVFAKFSMPRSNFVWSKHGVVTQWNGQRQLMLRLVNARNSEVIDANARVIAVMGAVTPEGRQVRRVVDLTLSRPSQPLFYGGWVLFHPIDEASPLHGMSHDQWVQADVVLVAIVTGIESTYAQTVHSRQSWVAEDIRFDHVFEDAIQFKSDGTIEIHHANMHLTKPENEA